MLREIDDQDDQELAYIRFPILRAEQYATSPLGGAIYIIVRTNYQII